MKCVMMAIGALGGGGAERVVSVWAKQLNENGVDAAVLIYGHSPDDYPLPSGIKVYSVTEKYEDYQTIPYLKRVKRIRKILNSYRPDVLISFIPKTQITMMFSSIGIKLRRIETVRVNPWKISEYSKPIQLLWKLCFKTCYAAIVQTPQQIKVSTTAVQRKCIVIPNPIEKRFVDTWKCDYSTKQTKYVAVGRICAQKNYPLMLTAFKRVQEQHNEISLKIFGVGDEQMTQMIRQMIFKLKLDGCVTLCGRSNHIEDKYRDSDAYLMSTDFEGMPNALAEAMAVGLVCISTDCKTGPGDLISDGQNGFLTPVGDVDAFAAAILKGYQMNQDEAERVGQNARSSVLDFCGADRSVSRLIELTQRA